jgi:hypothetical protein
MKSYNTSPPAPTNLTDLLKQEVGTLKRQRHPKIVKYLGMGPFAAPAFPALHPRRAPCCPAFHLVSLLCVGVCLCLLLACAVASEHKLDECRVFMEYVPGGSVRRYGLHRAHSS